jgi:glutathione transport system substrate-binding protein
VTHLFSRLLLAALIAVGACGAAFASKDLVVGVPDNLTGLDPADLNDNVSQSAARLMFEGLYILDHDMKLVPALAESYETNEEATEFIFHLRKGVSFHDGTPFNAAAVKFSFDRTGNPANHLKRQSLFSMVDHTDVVDDYTVRVVLKYPFGAFVNDIAHPGAMIVSPKSVQEFGKEVMRHPSGTGRYEFVSWSADTLKMKTVPRAGDLRGRARLQSSGGWIKRRVGSEVAVGVGLGRIRSTQLGLQS